MRHGLSHTLALISLGLAGFLVTPIQAQTTANGPYYATPSWDQTLPSSTRFIVLSNMNSEAVLDRETGLVWQRSPEVITQSWAAGTARCQTSATGGRFGWRLPTVQELGSLLDPTATSTPPLPAGHPFIGIAGRDQVFWTATTVDQVPTNARHVFWAQDFFPPFQVFVQVGGVGFTTKTETLRSWCVRGGLLAAPQ